MSSQVSGKIAGLQPTAESVSRTQTGTGSEVVDQGGTLVGRMYTPRLEPRDL